MEILQEHKEELAKDVEVRNTELDANKNFEVFIINRNENGLLLWYIITGNPRPTYPVKLTPTHIIDGNVKHKINEIIRHTVKETVIGYNIIANEGLVTLSIKFRNKKCIVFYEPFLYTFDCNDQFYDKFTGELDQLWLLFNKESEYASSS